MRHLAVLVALGLAALLPRPADACQAPHVDVSIRYASPWVEYLSIATLNEKHQQKGESIWLGSTSSRLRGEILFYPGTQSGASAACEPPKLRIDLSFAEYEVNLAKELQKFPCIHKEVADHEEKHVALYKIMLSEMGPFVKAYADRRARHILDHTPHARQRDELQSFVHGELQTTIENQWNILKSKQKALDTPEEYRRISHACPAEMEGVMKFANQLKPSRRLH